MMFLVAKTMSGLTPKSTSCRNHPFNAMLHMLNQIDGAIELSEASIEIDDVVVEQGHA